MATGAMNMVNSRTELKLNGPSLARHDMIISKVHSSDSRLTTYVLSKERLPKEQ